MSHTTINNPDSSLDKVLMKRPKFLLLDAVHTLMDLKGGFDSFFMAMAERGGRSPSREEVSKALNEEFRIVIDRLKGRTDFSIDMNRERAFWRTVDAAIFRQLGFEEDSDAMADMAFEQFESGDHFVLFDETPAALNRIKEMGIPIGIVSNGTHGMDRWLRASPLNDIAEFIIVSVMVGWEKPGTEIFQIALEKAGIGPFEALYAGDSLHHDVHGAQRASIPVVWFTEDPNGVEPGCPILPGIGKLPGFLETLAAEQRD